jgi:hypothetical protein
VSFGLLNNLLLRLPVWILNNLVFKVWGYKPHAQPPSWRTRVSLFVWLLPLDPSGMGESTSSYATAGIALRVSGAHKPHHYDKVETPSVGAPFPHQQWLHVGERGWISMCMHYAQYFGILCEANELDSDEASSVAILQEIFYDWN